MADDYSIVKAWIDDVCRSAADRDAVLSVLKAERRALEELERMPPSYQTQLEATRARIVGVIEDLERREAEHAAKVPEFVELVGRLPNAALSRALVLRAVEGKTWQKCADAVHYDRKHLERLYKRSMPDLVRIMPDRYKGEAESMKHKDKYWIVHS